MKCFSTFSKNMMQQPCEAQSVYDFFTNSVYDSFATFYPSASILKVARLLDEAGIVIYVSSSADFPAKWHSKSQFWFVRTLDILEKDPDLWTIEETEKLLEAVFSNTSQAILLNYLS